MIAPSEQAKRFRIRAIIGRMRRPRKQDMTPEEQKFLLQEFRAAYARFAARQRARGVVPWPTERYYYHWWTCQKATFIRSDMRKRAEAFVRGAA